MMRRWKFFNKDGRREPFLINAPLVIANPRRKKTVAKRRTKRRKNYLGAGAIVNRPRKHHRRRNPPSAARGGMNIMGLPIPAVDRLLAATAGALGPELVEMMVDEFAPDFKNTSGGQTAVQIGSYALPPLIALMLFPKRVVGDVVLGELLNLSVAQGRKLIGSMTGASSVAGYIPSLPAPNTLTAAQLGGYIRQPNVRGYRTTPDRLALRYPNAGYRTNQF